MKKFRKLEHRYECKNCGNTENLRMERSQAASVTPKGNLSLKPFSIAVCNSCNTTMADLLEIRNRDFKKVIKQ